MTKSDTKAKHSIPFRRRRKNSNAKGREKFKKQKETKERETLGQSNVNEIANNEHKTAKCLNARLI